MMAENTFPEDRPFPEEQLAELAALADGSLPPSRRAVVEARVAASPRLQALLAEQRRAVSAMRDRTEVAPLSLRTRVEGMRRPKAAPRRRLGIAAALAGAAATALALVIALPGGGPSGPTVAEAAALGSAPPTAPSPRPYSNRPMLLDAEVEEVPFPNWAEQFGWRTAGARVDRVKGRPAKTVFYAKHDRQIAYTIVARPTLALPSSGARQVRAGTELRTFSLGDRLVVTWRRKGHTCVLSSSSVSRPELLALAAWKGGGTVPY